MQTGSRIAAAITGFIMMWTADANLILGEVERLCKPISNSGH